MDKVLIDLLTLLIPQIPFALLVFVVMERQQDRHQKSCQEMLAIVDKQNTVYLKICDNLDEIKAHLYLLDTIEKNRKKAKNDVSSQLRQ